jgi:hypothetical protein
MAAVAAVLAAAVYATQPRPLYLDANVFILIGHGLFTGHTPYAGIFDDKPPAIYLIGGLAWLLDPADPSVPTQALSAAAIACTATACGWLTAALTDRIRLGVAVALVVAAASSIPSINAGGGSTELFCEAGLAVSFAAVVAFSLGRPGIAIPVVAGAAFAIAVNFSELALGAVPALAILWLAAPRPRGASSDPPGRRTKVEWLRLHLLDPDIAVAGLAAAAVTAMIWLPVVLSGGMPAAIDALTRFVVLYRNSSIFGVRAWLVQTLSVWPIWAPCLVACLIPAGRRTLIGYSVARSRLGWVGLLWLIGTLGLLLYGKRVESHYVLLVIPPLALLFGATLDCLLAEPAKTWKRAAAVCICGAIALGLGWQLRPASGTSPQIASNARIAAYLDSHSVPSDTIFVWGNNPDLYIRSDRFSAGKFVLLSQMFQPGYSSEAIESVSASWDKSPPRFIVTRDETAPASYGLDPLVHTSTNWPVGPATYAPLQPLVEYVQAHYTLVATVAGAQIWELTGNP